MMIHPAAVIYPGAQIDEGVEIGPYAVIGANVRIGKGTKIGASAVVDGWTTIGENNRISQLASIGAPPQDIKYKGEPTTLEIGNNNIIREFVTMHLGSPSGAGRTVVGSNNMFMSYSHIAHDCSVGNNVIMANSATLAGHVTVENNVIFGGLCAVHQFTRIGEFAMIGGGTMIGQDILPYTIATSEERRAAKLRGLNLIGLKRNGFSEDLIRDIKTMYKTVVLSGLKLPDAVVRIRNLVKQSPQRDHFLEFIEGTKRGICKK
jgi:UDP-N-acetylglucosamine acyltransferase